MEQTEQTAPLERMGEFFDRRLEGYETHQLETIAGAKEFYPFTAAQLPAEPEESILDLGCGTGLELSWYFRRNPTARVTGIDLAPGMLAVLGERFREKALTLICGSYFDAELGEERYDGAVSVESVHHFTAAEKLPLYRKLYAALRPGGAFLLTDYFAADDEEERRFRRELLQLREEQGLAADVFYHYDTPLTVDHEREALERAGFAVELLGRWAATACLRAVKPR